MRPAAMSIRAELSLATAPSDVLMFISELMSSMFVVRSNTPRGASIVAERLALIGTVAAIPSSSRIASLAISWTALSALIE